MPGYLSYVSGLPVSELDDAQARRVTLRASLLFVAGFTTVFTVLGIIATVLGSLFLRNQDGIVQGFGVVIIALGLATMGVLRVPLLMREKRLDLARVPRSGRCSPTPTGRIAVSLGVAAIPESFLISPYGLVVSKILGGVRAEDSNTSCNRPRRHHGDPAPATRSIVPARLPPMTPRDPARSTRTRRRSPAPLVATWVGAAVVLGLLLALARAAEGPLDDPDQAWQRPGFLDAGDLPAPAPTVAPGIPAPGRPTVVFFVRPDGLAELCDALAASALPARAATAAVVAGSTSGRCAAVGAVVGDPDGAVGNAYGLRRPRGGGPSVGYAVVDAAGAIRYRTLDPEVADQLDEVVTIVAALS